jgi:hypothetical protein
MWRPPPPVAATLAATAAGGGDAGSHHHRRWRRRWQPPAPVATTLAATTAGGDDAGAGSGSSLGDPQGSTLFYPVWLYQQGFQYFAMGYASAMAVVLFVVALAVTAALPLVFRRYGHIPRPLLAKRPSSSRPAPPPAPVAAAMSHQRTTVTGHWA